jgi:arylsulfatase A-like enzyme
MRPIHRFAAPAEGPITAGVPTATLADDTRPVLRAPPTRVVTWSERAEVGRDGSVAVAQILRTKLATAPQLLVRAELASGRERHTTPPQLVAIRRTPAGRLFRARFRVPPEWRASEVAVSVRGIPIGTEELGSIETEEVPIPAGARLEFAIGVLEPELGSDPVEFRIEACAEACEPIWRDLLRPARPEDRGWRDARVALDAWAGSRRRLVFRAERLAEAASFSLPLWANPTLYAPDPGAASSPSLILLSVDTLRADHLPSYGYPQPTAPFLDSLARRGALFEHCLAASTATTPSHMTMFTSLPPSRHGATDGFKTLSGEIATLPEWIRAHGIDTAAITEDGWVGTHQGFARGFDVFVENKSARVETPEGWVERTFAQARNWLELQRDKRFFLFLHTYQVHAPYAPPERYAGLFDPPQGREAAAQRGEAERSAGPREQGREAAAQRGEAERSAGPREQGREAAAQRAEGERVEGRPSHEQWRDDYDREIRYTDDELRELLERIEALGLAPWTVFLVTSDHGEAFLEHGLVEHGGRLHEEVVRVPLLLAGPGIPAGRRIAAPVSHVDLLPTVLDLLGIAVPEWAQGRSLVPLLDGRELEAGLAGRALFSETRTRQALVAERRMIDFPVPAFMVREGSRKLLRYPDPAGGHRYELYDLASDPGERRDLYPSEGGSAADLRALLDAYEAASGEQRRRVDAWAGGVSTPAEQSVPLEPAQEEKLRALGYLEE